MTALTADRDTRMKAGELEEHGVAASTKIYAGAATALNASGYAVPVSAASALVFVGRAEAQADNSSGSAADINVKTRRAAAFKWVGSGLTIADIGKDAWFSDDQTITTTPGHIYAGEIVQIDSATEAWVLAPHAAPIQSGGLQASMLGQELDLDTADDECDLVSARQNVSGCVALFVGAVVSEQLAGDTEDQAVITIYDEDDTSLGTITFADAGADAVGDLRLGLNAFAATAGDALKTVAAGKKIYAKVTTATSGTGAAGKAKVSAIVARLA